MYNIETMGKLLGFSRRTIRYYVQRGLVHPPEGFGRGAYYTDEHLERLKTIKKWSEQGVPIFQMKEMLKGKTEEVKLDTYTGIRVTRWERLKIKEGIELSYIPGSFTHTELKSIADFIDQLKGETGNE